MSKFPTMTNPTEPRPRMRDRPRPPYPYKTTFPPTYLDLPPPEEPSEPQPGPPAKPPSKRHPLAAAPQPAAHYPQNKCPICKTPIADAQGHDFIGNVACLHRGPCTKPQCIEAYYGVSDKWASPYQGKTPLYCQAPGCKKREITAWCLVESTYNETYYCIYNQGTVHPNAKADYQKAEEKYWEEVKKEEAEIERKKEKEKKRKERADESLTGSCLLDCCVTVAFGCMCCFGCLSH